MSQQRQHRPVGHEVRRSLVRRRKDSGQVTTHRSADQARAAATTINQCRHRRLPRDEMFFIASRSGTAGAYTLPAVRSKLAIKWRKNGTVLVQLGALKFGTNGKKTCFQKTGLFLAQKRRNTRF